MLTLDQTAVPIKTLTNDRIGEVSADVETEPPSGSIVIQIGLGGINSIWILATHSNESDRLSECLAVVRPLIDLLEQTFTDEGARLS